MEALYPRCRSSTLITLAGIFFFFCIVLTVTDAQNSPQDFLDPHNAARAEVGVGPLEWDDTVAGYAQWYVDKCAVDCNFPHSGGPYGENLYWGPSGYDWTAADAVQLWVDEKQYYDYPSNSCVGDQMCGHYTQVVWQDSTHLGCARAECHNNGDVLMICNYNPPGNWEGQWPYLIEQNLLLNATRAAAS